MENEEKIFICTQCGEIVSKGTDVCPGCGAGKYSGRPDEKNSTVKSEIGEYTRHAVPSRWGKIVIGGVALVLVSVLLIAWLPQGLFILPVLLAALGISWYFFKIYPTKPSSTERRLKKALLQMVQGDEAKLERLLEYERKRSPGSDRIKLLEAAVYRLTRDRG